MTYLEKAKDLQDMILNGQLLAAFDKYYHEDVVMIEGTGDTTSGKAENRVREEQFLGNIAEFHGAGVLGISSNEDDAITMAEVWMDVTFKDGNRVKMEQTTVQRWKDGQIINERFYYNA